MDAETVFANVSPAPTVERQRLTVRGIVQGVGFRPFVYTLAQRYQLAGFVGNASGGVFIEIEGIPAALADFTRELRDNPPPLAHIEAVSVETLPPLGDTAFKIVTSQAQSGAHTLISPDICICDDCLRELFDPTNRRYRYPFINCTHCGPRFTITRDLPYDRPLTTMASFKLCPACQAEYDDPLDRRFHAQPNACPVCGPQVWLQWGCRQIHDAPIEKTIRLLKHGLIVAVKGIGGFHLACDATSDSAVQTLRERKGRVDKPFAVMARDLDVVRRFADVSPLEAELLTSRERPIVLLRKKANSETNCRFPSANKGFKPLAQTEFDNMLADGIAPGNPYVGVMLPYTPLHYLLIGDTPLVLTSGNFSGEPILKDNDDALDRLAPLADAFLLHDRDIHVHCDDSVMRVFEDSELPIRRSRGYAPFPVRLPFSLPPVLATGAELKNTFCITRDDHAFMSQHIGDMENVETLDAFAHAVGHFQALFRVEPQALVADSHPRYLAARWAEEEAKRRELPLIRIQHHHAHIAAVMAENGLDGREPVIGVCFDGTGYGTDGAIWGGEALVADYRQFRRAAHVAYVPLPGGDSAVKHPSRLALAYLWAAGAAWDESLPPVAANSEMERRVIRRQLETGFQTVPTSSMGRLFDAVAALAGVRQTITYEAQAAMEFEALVDARIADSYPFPLCDSGRPLTFNPAPLIRAVAADVSAGVDVSVIAAKFHNAIADGVLNIALQLHRTENLNRVALSGGVFQNVQLLALTLERLRAHGFDVLTHRQVPPNDGGLALGQAVIGGHLVTASREHDESVLEGRK